MKKIIAVIMTALVAAIAFTACSSSDNSQPQSTDGQSETVTGSVATDGSTSMQKVIGALGRLSSRTQASHLHTTPQVPAQVLRPYPRADAI